MHFRIHPALKLRMLNYKRCLFAAMVGLLFTESFGISGTSQVSSFRRILPGYEFTGLNAPERIGNAFLLSCSNACHKLSCNLWTWNPDTQECAIYKEATTSEVTEVSGTPIQNYVRSTQTGGNSQWIPITGTWEDAEKFCELQGAILSYVPNQAWMKSFMLSIGSSGFFTGVRRYKDGSDKWYDLEGNLVSRLLEWAPTQPGTDDEYCTAFFGPGLGDVRCDTVRPIGAFCRPSCIVN